MKAFLIHCGWRRGFALLLLWWLFAGGTALPLRADDVASRVVILANARQPESIALAEFYAQQRGIPRANIIALPLPETETIGWREFIDEIYAPFQAVLYEKGWLEGVAGNTRDALGRKRYAFTGHRIAYLVVCRGVPLRIAQDGALPLLDGAGTLAPPNQFQKNESAVDSEFSLLAQSGYEINGLIQNPLFNQQVPPPAVAGTVIKVSRLDGPSFAQACQLVTSALVAEQQGLRGRFYIDRKGPYPEGDGWLDSAQQQLELLGFDGDTEATGETFTATARFDAPAFYFGWYRNDLGGALAVAGFKFPPGAVALHIHSFSARTLHSETEGWCGPLLARGVTATVGNVFEPDLRLTHRPNLLVEGLRRGLNFGDAVYCALPALSWQGVAIGDPLYRPFAVALEQQDITGPLGMYVIMRQGRLLARARRLSEARVLLENAARAAPSLPLALMRAQWAWSENDPASATRLLLAAAEAAPRLSSDWSLRRETASLLAKHGAVSEAVKLYAALSQESAPDQAAMRVLLIEALRAADVAGEADYARYFAEQLATLGKPR